MIRAKASELVLSEHRREGYIGRDMAASTRPITGVVLACLLSLSPGCHADRSRSTTDRSASAAPDTSATPEESHAPRPASTLDVAAFMKRGVPSVDRPWSAKDYSDATGALRGLKPDALPNLGDPKSGPVFARFVAEENLKFIRDESIPLDSRFPEAIELVGEGKKLLALYLDGEKHGTHLEPELLGLTAMMVTEAAAMLDLSGAFIKTLNPKDPKYGVRMEGAARMTRGASEVARGCLATFTEKVTYSTVDRRTFAEALRGPFPKLIASLAAADRQEISAKLAEVIADEKDATLKDSLVALQTAVNAEPPRPLTSAN